MDTTSQGNTPPVPCLSLYCLAAVALLGTLLRLVHVGVGFHGDEVFDVLIAGHPAVGIPSLVAADYHPPLYFFILHLWMLIGGHAERWVRIPSITFGVAIIPMTYVTVKRWVSHNVALLSALFVAISPFHIGLAESAKMYPMMLFLVLVTAYALQKVLDGSSRWWVLYSLSSVCLIYTHNLGTFIIAGTALWGLLASGHDPRQLGRWALAHLFVVAVYLPWVPLVLHQAVRAPHAALAWVARPTTLRAWTSLWYSYSSPYLPVGERVQVKLSVPLFLLALTGLAHARKQTTTLLPMFALGGVPLILAVVLGAAGVPVFHTDGLLSVSIVLYVFIAIGLLSLRGASRAVGVTATGILLIMSLVGWSVAPVQDWRAVASYLKPRVRSGDLVLLPDSYDASRLEYYWTSNQKLYVWPERLRSSSVIWIVESQEAFARASSLRQAVLRGVTGVPDSQDVADVLIVHYGRPAGMAPKT